MTSGRRLFFDISFTRTQKGSVGITRTVRRLRDALDGVLPVGSSCIPVAFHTSGFKAITIEMSHNAPSDQGRAADSLAARLLRTLTEGGARRLAFACFPLPLLYGAWKLHSAWTFNALSGKLPAADFRPGDLLVMCDAAWSYQAWAGATAARQQGASVVLMIHDLIPLRQPQFCVPLFTLVFEKWLRAMLPAVDLVICNSQATESDLHDYASGSRLRLPTTTHFRLGSDLPPDGQAAPPRKRIAEFLGDAVPCFAAIGTIEPRKNYPWLLGVFDALWAEGHDVRLLIAGRPNADSHHFIQEMARHAEQGRRLLTMHDATDAEVAHIYNRCRALLFPSSAEGFGLPLVEARVRGAPVIAGDLPVFSELADDGVFLYPRNDIDAAKTMILDHARESRRGLVGAMPTFTWQDSARQFLRAVDSALPPRTACERLGQIGEDQA